jgi:hypothetical protein
MSDSNLTKEQLIRNAKQYESEKRYYKAAEEYWTLGDLYSSENKYFEAGEAYEKALKHIRKVQGFDIA